MDAYALYAPKTHGKAYALMTYEGMYFFLASYGIMRKKYWPMAQSWERLWEEDGRLLNSKL